MRVIASLPGLNLFSSLPSPPSQQQQQQTFSPPIPIPKYPKPPPKKHQNPQNAPQNPSSNPNHPALKLPHRRTKYYKPVKPGTVLSSSDDDGDPRSVVIGESGVSYLLPGAPFEFQYSYSETPSVEPVAIREPAFLPFAPPSMPRPWTGKAPLKKSKRSKVALFDSFNPPPPKKGMKPVALPGPFEFGKLPQEGKTREEVLGAPLRRDEVLELIKPMLSDNRQVNLGEVWFWSVRFWLIYSIRMNVFVFNSTN